MRYESFRITEIAFCFIQENQKHEEKLLTKLGKIFKKFLLSLCVVEFLLFYFIFFCVNVFFDYVLNIF